jgi:hypothetical protein
MEDGDATYVCGCAVSPFELQKQQQQHGSSCSSLQLSSLLIRPQLSASVTADSTPTQKSLLAQPFHKGEIVEL